MCLLSLVSVGLKFVGVIGQSSFAAKFLLVVVVTFYFVSVLCTMKLLSFFQ